MWKPLTVAIIRLSGAGDFWTEIFVAFLKVVFLRKHSNQYNFTTPWILLKERPFEDTHCDKTDFYVKQNIGKKMAEAVFAQKLTSNFDRDFLYKKGQMPHCATVK